MGIGCASLIHSLAMMMSSFSGSHPLLIGDPCYFVVVFCVLFCQPLKEEEVEEVEETSSIGETPPQTQPLVASYFNVLARVHAERTGVYRPTRL